MLRFWYRYRWKVFYVAGLFAYVSNLFHMPIVLKILWFYLVTHPKTALLHFFSIIKFKTFFYFHKVLENQIQVFEEINGSLVLQNESNSVFGFFYFFSSLYYLFHWVYKYKFFFFFLPLVYCVNYEFLFLFF